MTAEICTYLESLLFQLTSSQGGWLLHNFSFFRNDNISTHILTRRMTVSFSSFSSFSSISTHILTRRMTMVVARLTSSLLHFNSHPHKEDDFRYLIASENENISTHILTRRMTSMLFALGTFTYISTHILTRRMTSIRAFAMQAAVFQLTSSQGGWREVIPVKYSRSYFNSHPHKEDDAISGSNTFAWLTFQLTSSQGGWPWRKIRNWTWH